jgi:hypothetical protein
MMHGGELSMASSDELISQGLAIATSKFVGQRVEAMRQRMSQARQERGLRELDKLLTRVDALGKRARAGHEVAPDEALAMLRERHAILQAELNVYRRLATNPDTKTHATEALSKAKAEANLGEGFIDATLRLAKLSPIVDGERYEGTPKQIKDALAAVQATGSVTHSYDKKSGVLRIKVGDKTIEISEIGHRRSLREAADVGKRGNNRPPATTTSNSRDSHEHPQNRADNIAHPSDSERSRREIIDKYENLTASDFRGADDPRLREIAVAASSENNEVASRVRAALKKAGVKDVEIQFRAKSLHSILGKLKETPGMRVKEMQAEYTRLIGRIAEVNKGGSNLANMPDAKSEVDAYFGRVQTFLDRP